MNENPCVSIVIPIFNVGSYLQQCLESVRDQTLTDLEVICIDDGSTDESPRIVDAFCEADERFVAVHKENGGYGSAVNVGLSHARGQYVGIVEPDDYLDLTMYEKLFSAAGRNGLPDIVKAAYWRVVKTDEGWEQLPANYLHALPADKPFRLADNAEFLFHHPSIWSAIYRRDFLERNDIRMHEIPGAGWADNPWLIDTLVRADAIVFVDECLYFYREFNAGASSVVKDPTILSDRWVDMDNIIRALKVSAPRILEGHYNRACWHLRFLVDGFDEHDSLIKDCIQKIVSRVDYGFVCDCPRIPNDLKDLLHTHVSTTARLKHRVQGLLGIHHRVD